MFFIVTFTITIILLSVFTSLRKLKNGLKIIFILLAVFLALRYDFGPDYKNYLESFIDINRKYNFTSFMRDEEYSKEPGWTMLCLFFGPIGFQGLVAAMSILTCSIYYFFIKECVPLKWQWLAITYYILSQGLFWIPMSSMRQALVGTMFMLSFKYIYNKNLIKSLIIIVICFLIHRSAVILFPFIFFGFIPVNYGKVVSITITTLFICMFSLAPIIFQIVVSDFLEIPLVSDYVYSHADKEGAETFGIGGVIYLIPFALTSFYLWHSKDREYDKYVILISAVGHLILPLQLLNGLVGRLSYYFSVFSIASFPLTIAYIKQNLVRAILIMVYFAMTIYSFSKFFSQPDWVSFSEYKTILSQ